MQFLVMAYDGTDEQALERRMAAREKHLAHATPLKEGGKLLLGGAMLNDEGKMIGSTLVYDFPSREDLDACIAQDPYVLGKVWERIEVQPFRVALLASKH